MLPTINGKSLLDCNEDDLNEIIDNPDYRESEYLDYKRDFSILNYSKDKNKKEQAIIEFRNDVCAMANGNGGYLIYGIGEGDGNNGIPHDLVGFETLNINFDKLLLHIKTWLQTIQPRIPYYRTNVIELQNGKYVLIMYIQHDSFAPYFHMENECCYRIFKRVGNSKHTIPYMELRNMFIQSLNLEKEIKAYREERVSHYNIRIPLGKKPQYLLLHFIPETFTDSSHNIPMILERRKGIKLSEIFNSFESDFYFQPNVEGVKFTSYRTGSEIQIYNNGIAELFYLFDDEVEIKNSTNKLTFRWIMVRDSINQSVKNYLETMKGILGDKKVYVCISIIGCQGVVTDDNFGYYHHISIDRDMLMCDPVVFEMNSTDSTLEKTIDLLELNFMLSIGIRGGERMDELIKEVYS